jgi:hypothetical protein
MTGPEHYRAAERLADQANHYTYGDGGDPVTGAALAAEAQVHATLALAAATALAPIGEGWDRDIFTQWGLLTGWSRAELDLDDEDEATS